MKIDSKQENNPELRKSDKELKALNTDHTKTKNKIVQAQSREIAALQEAHRVNLQSLKSVYENQLNDLEKTVKDLKTKARIEYETTMSEISNKQKDEITDLKIGAAEKRTELVDEKLTAKSTPKDERVAEQREKNDAARKVINEKLNKNIDLEKTV